MLHCLLAHALDGAHGIDDAALVHVEMHHGAVDRRRHHLDPHAPGFLTEVTQLVRVAQIQRHGRGHELHRVVRLEPGRMIGDERIGCRVRLVEAVVGELGHKVEDRAGLILVDAALHRTVNETGALHLHLGGDLLAHGAAQKVSFAERVAGEHLGDLHHLLLIDDDAIRLFQDGFQQRMQVIGLQLAMLDRVVDRDVLHRARTVERHQRNDVLETVGLHARNGAAHALAFQLEHAHRFAGCQKTVGLLVIQRHFLDLDMDALARDQFQRRVDDGQRLEAEEVELHQPGFFHHLHVELRHRHVGARIAVERDQLFERPVADHHTGGVGGGVAVQPFQLLRHFQKALDHLFLARRLTQARLVGNGLRQRYRVRRIGRHQLAQPVHLAIGHLQDAPDVAQHGAGLQRTEGDDLRHLAAAIFLLHIADHFFAPVLAEVDVEVRHRHTFRVEEALEQQREAHGVEIGDGQRPGHQRACTRTTARPHRNVMRLGPFDEVGHDEEVAGELHPLDDRQLEFEPVPVVLFRQPIGKAVDAQTLGKAFAGLALQFGRLGLFGLLRVCIGTGKARQDGVALQRPVMAAQRNLDGVLHRLRQIGKQLDHLLPGLEIMLRRQPPPFLVRDHPAFGNGDQRVMGFIVLALGEERLVGGDQRQAHVIGQIDEPGFRAPFVGHAVALKLHVAAPVEGFRQPGKPRLRQRAVAGQQRLADGASRAAGQENDPFRMRFEIGLRHMRQLARGRVEEGPARQLHQVAVAAFAHGQQNHVKQRRITPAVIAALLVKGDGNLAADDGLNTGAPGLAGELLSTEQVARVGDRQRRLRVGLGQVEQLLDRQRAFQQRQGRMDAQVNETGICRHGTSLSGNRKPACRQPAPASASP